MNLFRIPKMKCIAIGAVVMLWCAGSEKLSASTVTYAVQGTLTVISGSDQFKLAGQQTDTMSVVVDPSVGPKKHGQVWAVYTPEKLTATIFTGLLPTPVSVSNGSTALLLSDGPSVPDLIEVRTGMSIIGLKLTITAMINLPDGTFSSTHIQPFASVAINPTIATLTYSDGTNTTTLGITGTVQATAAAIATTPAVAVHLDSVGARTITTHGDGSQTVRSVHAAPIDLGAQTDLVELQFYASGVRNASEVRVQIAGRDVPVLYAGPAIHSPGLDQVSVQVPRDMAGSGEVDVTLTANGETANPVRIRFQ